MRTTFFEGANVSRSRRSGWLISQPGQPFEAFWQIPESATLTSPKANHAMRVRHQSASVRIYAGQIRGKTCYKIAFYLDVRRHRRLVGDLEKTGREAKLVADVSDFPLRRLSCALKPILGLAEKSISCQ